MSKPDPFIALLKGIAASLLVYWIGVWCVREFVPDQLYPYARYLGWAACVVATLVTSTALGEPFDRVTLFGVAALAVTIPMTFMGESVRRLHVLTFDARVDAMSGAGVNIAARNHYFAFHLLPVVTGAITIICVAGTIMFRQRPDRY